MYYELLWKRSYRILIYILLANIFARYFSITCWLQRFSFYELYRLILVLCFTCFPSWHLIQNLRSFVMSWHEQIDLCVLFVLFSWCMSMSIYREWCLKINQYLMCYLQYPCTQYWYYLRVHISQLHGYCF